ncbi:MAG: D-glycero-beta-D-manno-heptose 1-phosphate adenylyltransferase [Candidatus Omnitrophica bacterium]|nr:D-glycero-beta-D-manno-heptose 1-phosphate adenylyltransferase [Candidatus Omnitrophota bacterium]
MGKLKNLTEIKKIVTDLKRKKKKVVFTNGCFDILHYGHLKYLEKCKRLGDVLVIGLNSDASVKKIKGKKRPITGEKERAAVLSSLEFVDYVITFNDATPAKLIKALTPDVLAKGGDWKTKDIVGGRHVKNHGGRAVSIPFIKGYSTTKIIKRIKKT